MPRASKYRPARRGDHSSRRRIAAPLKRPTRGLRTLQADFVNYQGKRAGPALPSYLALHHAGFSVPPMLPSERWALTPPFHPCQTRASKKTSRRFCLLPVIEMLRPIRQNGLAAFSRRRFILCGTIRGRSSRFAFAHHANQPPGVTRRVALRLVALRLRATVSGLSSRPAALRRRNRRSPDLPARLNYTRSLPALMSLETGQFFPRGLLKNHSAHRRMEVVTD